MHIILVVLHKLLQRIVRRNSNRSNFFNNFVIILQVSTTRLLRKLRKIESIRLTVEFNRNFTFLAIYYSSTSVEEGTTKDNRAKTILHRTKYKKVCRIFYLPAEYFNISHNPNWRDCLFICKMDSDIYVLDLTRLNLVHDILIKCEGNRAGAGSQMTLPIVIMISYFDRYN